MEEEYDEDDEDDDEDEDDEKDEEEGRRQGDRQPAHPAYDLPAVLVARLHPYSPRHLVL